MDGPAVALGSLVATDNRTGFEYASDSLGVVMVYMCSDGRRKVDSTIRGVSASFLLYIATYVSFLRMYYGGIYSMWHSLLLTGTL